MLRRDEVSFLLGPNQSARVNCPMCGGAKTLSISKMGGMLKWYCFRASCAEKGKASLGASLEDIHSRLQNTPATKPEMPGYLTNALANTDCVKLLKRYGLLDVVGYTTAYDPRLNRLVFTKPGAGTGRTLTCGVLPKWYRYGDAEVLFSYGEGKTCIVCEDVISAIKCSRYAASLALQGTKLLPQHISYLRRFDTVRIALDPDAKLLALGMAQCLKFYVGVEVMMLRDDPKYLSWRELQECLKTRL